VLHITPWERDVLQMLADGKAAAELAACLGVCQAEVESGLARLFAVLGAATTNEAIAVALKRGLLTSSGH